MFSASSHSRSGSPIMIRPMAPEDLPRVLEVEGECHSHPWSGEHFLNELANPVGSIDLLFFGGKLAGYLCSWRIQGELHILNVAVAPSFRRRGLARLLVVHVLGAAPGATEKAFLEVRVGNAGAIALYRSIGFREAGLRRGYYPDGEDALLMEYVPTTEEGRTDRNNGGGEPAP